VSAARTTGRWIFRPFTPRESRGDDSLGFRIRLGTALRAGHGAGVEFALLICSGPDRTLSLVARDSDSFRWVTRALMTAYEHSQWARHVRPEIPGSNPLVWDARRVRPWPEAFRSPADGVSMVDGVVLALGALPRGVNCVWQFHPLPIYHSRWWEIESPSLPPSAPMRHSGRVAPLGSRLTEPLDASRERPLFWEVRVRLESEATQGGERLIRNAALALESVTRTREVNGLQFHPRRWWTGDAGVGFPLSDTELGMVLPTPACSSNGIPAHGSGPIRMLPLGRTSLGTVVGPEVEQYQGRHLAVLGETGMGKSSLLIALGHRVLAGAGLILFDPLGDTARALRGVIPTGVRHRMTWLAPESALGLNALQGIGRPSSPGSASQERQLNALVHSLRRVRSGRYADSGFWGPRLEEMLTRALRAAAAFPGGTLVDAHTLLASGGRGGFGAVPPEAVEVVRELADRIRSRPEDADGARRLLYEVTRSSVLVGMLCDRQPALDARELVDPGRIVLIAGDAEIVGESTARYLLSVYLAIIWSELLSRSGRGKTFVILDEAQWFAHESLSEMLRLGRRRNVHVVLATQAIASLPEPVAEAVWTNVADFVAFRGSPEEAREFARAARGIAPETILSLPRGEAALLLGKGNSVHWLRTAHLPRTPAAEERPSAIAEPRLDTPSPEAHLGQDEVSDLPSPPRPESLGAEEKVLAVITAQAHDSVDGHPIRISLTDLRREADPGGVAVRAVGGLLGRSGAIVRSDRDEFGTGWWIDPARIALLASRPHAEVESVDSDPTQHS
jgi:hypothetical protein